MAKDKNGFVLYSDLIHTVEKLTDEQAGRLLKHILRYVNDENPESGDIIIDLVFEPIKQHLKRDLKKWDDIIRARVSAGSKGGKQKQANLAKASKAKQAVANVAVSDSVKGNVSVSVNVKEYLFKEGWISEINNKDQAMTELEPRAKEFKGFGIDMFQELRYLKSTLFETDIQTARIRVDQIVDKNKKKNKKEKFTIITNDGKEEIG